MTTYFKELTQTSSALTEGLPEEEIHSLVKEKALQFFPQTSQIFMTWLLAFTDLSCHSFSLIISEPRFVGIPKSNENKSLLWWKFYQQKA